MLFLPAAAEAPTALTVALVAAATLASAISATCLAALLVVAQEQNMIHQGSFVRLHTLRNVRFNGLEALVLDQIKDKVKVEIAGTWR